MRKETGPYSGKCDKSIVSIVRPVPTRSSAKDAQSIVSPPHFRTDSLDLKLSSRSNQRAGMTLIEFLLVLAVLGVLFGLGAMLFTRSNQRTRLESATTELSQTVMQARSRALATGSAHRVLVAGSTQYVLQVEGGGSWSTERTIDLSGGVTLTAPASGSTLTFDTRGFADFSPASLVFQVTDGDDTLTIAPAMSGTTRIR